jgi:hypothetical protein
MNVVHKVRWVADATQAASRVNGILPVEQLIVARKREKVSLLEASFDNQAVRSCI